MTSLLNGVSQHKENQIFLGEKTDPFQVRYPLGSWRVEMATP